MNMPQVAGAAFERAAAAKLKELLGGVPWLPGWKIEANPAPFHRAFDLLARGKLPNGPEVQLWVECCTDPRPSRFPYVNVQREFENRSAQRVLVRVFAAPFISPRMAEICESHGWSWFDLAGNYRLDVPGLLHLRHTGNPPVHSPPRPSANLGTPEASRVVRALLMPYQAGIRWTQRSMQQHCQPTVSLGLVNKVVHHLRDEAFIEDADDGGFRLREPLKLLFAWRDAYRFDRHGRQGYFTFLQGKRLREALAQMDGIPKGEAAYAAFSAADFQAPYVRQPRTWLYLSPSLEEEFCRRLDAKRVDSGENLVVLTPDDDGVYYEGDAGTAGEPRLPATNLVQTYVDLCHCGERGQEAAEAVLEQRLKPEWKIRGFGA